MFNLEMNTFLKKAYREAVKKAWLLSRLPLILQCSPQGREKRWFESSVGLENKSLDSSKQMTAGSPGFIPSLMGSVDKKHRNTVHVLHIVVILIWLDVI